MPTYRDLAHPLIKLGYAALPRTTAATGKRPAVCFGHLTHQTSAQNKREMTVWDSSEPAALWLLDALPGSGAPDLDVLDYDDLAELPWGTSTYGGSPLTQRTGRDGGGEHHFFRRDPSRPRDEHGSIVRFVAGHAVDWKTWHGFVVAPGSLHPSGRTYQLYWNGVPIQPEDLTLEMILSLPVLDRDVADQVRGVAAEDDAYVDLGFDRASSRLSYVRTTGAGKFPKETAAATATFRAGAWTGKTVEAVAARVGEGETTCGCPHAEDGKAHKTDERGAESAVLRVSGGKPAYMVCFACSKTYTYGSGGRTRNSTSLVTSTSRSAVTRIELTLSDLTSEGWITSDVLGDALRKEKIRPRVIVLQLGQRRGKTELGSRLVKTALKKGERAVAVTPTRSLSREQARRLGLRCYLDLPENGLIEDSVSVCLPSLRRCPTWKVGADFGELEDAGAGLLVLDEVEQELRSLLGSHLTDAQARDAYHALLAHVRAAESVLLLDADAGPLTEALLRAAGRLEETAWFVGPAADPRDAVVWPIRSEWLADLMEAAGSGMRVAVAVHSVEEAQVLSRLLPVHEGLATACITGETVGDYDLQNLDGELANRGHLVYTPVLGTGVSITLRDHYDRVYALLCDGVGTGDDALQLVSRVRYPRETTLRIGRLGGGRTPAAWESDPAEVLRTWMDREVATMRKVGFVRDVPADIATYEDGAPAFRPDVVSYCRMVAAVHARDVEAGEGRVVDALCERLAGLGGRVLRVDPTAGPSAYGELCAQMRAGIKEEVREERVEAVAVASLPTEEKEKEIRRRGARTRDEANGLRKAGIERFYGPGAGSDPDTIRWDDRGRGRQRARAFAHVAAVLEGGEAMAGLQRLDERELEDGVSPARLHHASVHAAAMAGLLRRLGVDGGVRKALGLPHDEMNATVVVEPAKAVELAAWATSERGAAACRLLGITVRRDARKNPMQLAGTVIRACGLRLATEQEGRGARRGARSYWVDGVEEVLPRAAHYLTRLRTSPEAVGLRDDGLDDLDAVDLAPACGLTPEAAEAIIAELCAA